MAFVTRSKRDSLHLKNGTSKKVGPGSYLRSEMDLSVGMRYSVAPFCSTSTREKRKLKDNDCFETPGPGSYNPLFSNPKKQSYSMGKSDRFSSSLGNSPGPGNYNTMNQEWIKYQPKKGKRKSKKNIEFIKSGTTPSIPSKVESPKNNPGPGEYNHRSSFQVRKKKKSGVFQSQTKRNIFGTSKLNHHPGPGSYFSDDLDSYGNDDQFSKEFDYYNNSSAFQSRTRRFKNFLGTTKLTQSTPGPGQYLSINHHGGFKKKKVSKKYQNFGSSSLRLETKIDPNPGPGHFLKDHSLSDLNHHHNNGRFFHAEVPFGGTSNRFAMKNIVAPGPGKYDLSVIPKQKKFNQKPIPFQSSSKRFQERKQTAASEGGGESSSSSSKTKKIDFNTGLPLEDYHHQKSIKQSRKKFSSSSTFKSKAKEKYQKRVEEIRKRNKVDVPGPGYYTSSKNDWIHKNASHGKSFNVQDTRFKEKEHFVPGPGHYSANIMDSSWEKKGKKKTTNVRKSNRLSKPNQQKKRKTFQYHRPGPGSYNIEDSSWEKKSFNVTLL